MAQVVTNENIQELYEKGRVADFKPPEAPKVEAKEPPKEPKEEEVKSAVKEDDKEDENGLLKSDNELAERARQRINKKHREAKEAEEFAQKQWEEKRRLEARTQELERKLSELEAKVQPKTEEKQKPKPEDFKDMTEYAEALAEYKADEAIKKERQRLEVEKREAEDQARKIAFSQRIAKTMEKYTDYAEVVAQADGIVPPHISQYILESESGPEIGYYLAGHPDELEKLGSLSPIRAVAELGKIELRLSQPEAKPVKTPPAVAVSQAPAPIQPLNGQGDAVQKDPSKMTFKELREYERMRLLKARH